MEEERDHWSGRLPFILAAMGSAIGLGNVWRFPYIAYEHGGGAFLIPYFIALFTTGIPLMALEFGYGYRYLSGAPKAIGSVDKRFAWVGWLAILIGFMIVSFYTVIMAWCFIYMFLSMSTAWGGDPEAYFFNDFLNISDGPTEFGGMQLIILVSLAIMWLFIYWIVSKGVKRVGKVVMLTVPLPIILLVILVIRGLTLPGAMNGVNYYLTPNISELGSGEVWLAAYAQIFFTLSLAQGVMIAYASYLPKKAEITNNAYIISLANAGTSFFAGFAVFAILGFLAHEKGISIASQSGGFHLAFITYPTAISEMPFGAAAIGVIFFLMLLTLGIDSAFSMVEALVAGFEDIGIPHDRAVKMLCGLGFSVGLLYVSGAGYYFIQLVDHYAVEFGLIIVGLFQVIVIGWYADTEEMRQYINDHSEVKWGTWWTYSMKYVTPIVLTIVLVYNFWEAFVEGFAFEIEIINMTVEYPSTLVIAGGWGLMFVLFLLSQLLGRQMKWD